DSVMARLLAHREQPIPSLRAARPDVPDAVDAVFQRALAKSVVDRYQTMNDLIGDLSRLSRGEPPAVPPPASLFTSSVGGTDFNEFLKDIAAESAARRDSSGRIGRGGVGAATTRRWMLLGGGLVAVLAVLAGIAFSLQPKEGTLLVEVQEPGARIELLSADGK